MDLQGRPLVIEHIFRNNKFQKIKEKNKTGAYGNNCVLEKCNTCTNLVYSRTTARNQYISFISYTRVISLK